MKDLLLGGYVIVTTLNLEISRWGLADYVKEFHWSGARTRSTTIFPHLTNETTVFWRCLCRFFRLCFSSLIGSFSNDDGKRHFKINICRAELWLFCNYHIISWIRRRWWRTVQEDLKESSSSKYRELKNCYCMLTSSVRARFGQFNFPFCPQ